MDESALQDRLRRIEQRQYLLLVLLVIPYLVAIARWVGVATAGVVYTVVGVALLAIFIVYRRRNRKPAGR